MPRIERRRARRGVLTGPALHVAAPPRVCVLARVVQALAIGLRGCGIDTRVATILDEAGSGDHPFVAALREAGLLVVTVALSASLTPRQALTYRLDNFPTTREDSERRELPTVYDHLSSTNTLNSP